MILVIDNYDSFTYNLVQYLGQCGANPIVRRNDQLTLDEIAAMDPEGIVLSPGPCTPSEAGVCIDVSRAVLQPGSAIYKKPLLGVCLGHQTIGMVGGGTVEGAVTIMHGKASLVDHDGLGLFKGLPKPLSAIRYHSLTIRQGKVPPGFVVTSHAREDGEIMGIRHETLPIEGLQFHPESVLTECGLQIVQNFVDSTRA